MAGTATLISEDMLSVASKPEATAGTHSMCPGCGESIVIRLLGEVIEELGMTDQAIGVTGDGCANIGKGILQVNWLGNPHGRGPAAATGAKRMNPEMLVFTLQGDGDLIAEGTLEGVHAAARGENITLICVNNGVFADTGGQMSPTTLMGQRTKTSVDGRDASQGGPLKFPEMVATIDGAAFVARTAVHSPAAIQRTRKLIRRAFETQLEGKGYSLVEVLTMCPSGWFMTPLESLDYIEDKMTKVLPLGTLKDWQ